mmetsp:Transcript_10226/g.23940  ORF Transcript_10226/g.23940 Transcript_10226/m.23940 type:complete len:96 (-) Transcript_10226:1582-1869(-)
MSVLRSAVSLFFLQLESNVDSVFSLHDLLLLVNDSTPKDEWTFAPCMALDSSAAVDIRTNSTRWANFEMVGMMQQMNRFVREFFKMVSSFEPNKY